MEKRAKYAKIHPEMSNLDLTKILSKKYKELPDKKKVWTRTRTGWMGLGTALSTITSTCVLSPAAKVHYRVPAREGEL